MASISTPNITFAWLDTEFVRMLMERVIGLIQIPSVALLFWQLLHTTSSPNKRLSLKYIVTYGLLSRLVEKCARLMYKLVGGLSIWTSSMTYLKCDRIHGFHSILYLLKTPSSSKSLNYPAVDWMLATVREMNTCSVPIFSSFMLMLVTPIWCWWKRPGWLSLGWREEGKML